MIKSIAPWIIIHVIIAAICWFTYNTALISIFKVEINYFQWLAIALIYSSLNLINVTLFNASNVDKTDAPKTNDNFKLFSKLNKNGE